MFYLNPRLFTSVAAAAGATSDPPTLVVVLTGISLVFGILVILWLMLLLEGKIFQAIDTKKAQQTAPAAPVAAPAPAAAPAAPAAPAVQSGIQPEVVAAISGAIAAMDGPGASVRSVAVASQRVQMPSTNRGQWGQAGVVSYTEPF